LKSRDLGEAVEVATMHTEIPVKVTVWIDEEVAPLVVALNGFASVVTLDSCQGHDDEGGAYVLWTYREGVGAGMEFARRLAEFLSRHPAPYLLRAEWRPDSAEPLYELSCPPDSVHALAEAVSAFRMSS
jgi:hypothetical protein